MDGFSENVQLTSADAVSDIRLTLTEEQKKYILYLFNQYVNIGNDQYFCKNDRILEGIEITEYKKFVQLKSKLGKFYEALFCYLCNFQKPRKGFDLINKETNTFIELKTNWKTDNYNSKNNKFYKLKQKKIDDPNAEVIYACLNDERMRGYGVDYNTQYDIRIITGDRAWNYFCDIAKVDCFELIKYIKYLVTVIL